jgi:uroporphyrinogen decarboxylase
MDSKERFITALYKKVPDRIPIFDFIFSQKIIEKSTGIYPNTYTSELAIKTAEILGHDGIWIPFGGYSGISSVKDAYIDEWGTFYMKKSSVSWPIDAPFDYSIKSKRDLEKFTPPDPFIKERLTEVNKAIKIVGNRIAVFGGIQGPFTTAFLMLGLENLCFWLIDNCDSVKKIFEMSNEFYMGAAKVMVRAGVDGIILAEDLGYTGSLFISPDMYNDVLFPYLHDLISFVKSLDVPVILHCDGSIQEVLEGLVDMGIDAYHPVEKKAGMDILKVKKQFGDKICLIGNIDLVNTLRLGTPSDVEKEVKELIENVGPGGGYIVASEHSLNDGIPFENVIAIKDAVIKFGCYY